MTVARQWHHVAATCRNWQKRLVDGEKWGYLYLLVLNIYICTVCVFIYLYLIMECRSKGPCTVEICRDCSLQRPLGFQHWTLRFFFLSSRKFFFGEPFGKRFQDETPVKDKRGVRKRFARVTCLFAKNGRLQIKDFRSTTIYWFRVSVNHITDLQ